MECKKCQNMMGDALYNELSTIEMNNFMVHIASCKNCNEEFVELKATAGLVDERIIPDRDDLYWDNYWNKLESKIEKENSKKSFFQNLTELILPSPKAVKQIGFALTLVIVGVFIGKFGFNNEDIQQPINNISSQNNVVNAALQERTDRYIERSKVLLLGLVNFDPSDGIEGINFNKQKEISQDLIKEAAYLKNQYAAVTSDQLKKLVSDLEVILLQIANLEAEHNIEGIDLVKRGVDRKGIFLKININEMQKSNLIQKNLNEKSKVKI